MMKKRDISPSEAMKIYKSANGDLKYISKIYEYFENKGADNFVTLMIKIVKLGEFNESKKSIKKTNFNKFTSNREINYYDLEKNYLVRTIKMIDISLISTIIEKVIFENIHL